jgi:bifunctional non-homologous end joining protein LigD
MPVPWEELRKTKKPDALYFEPEAALRRVDKLGDLFAPVLETRQKLPAALPSLSPPPTPTKRPSPPATANGREPEYVEPMRAQIVSALPEGSAWQYEIKFDGYRTVAVRTSSGVTLYSRNGRTLNSRFPSIASALERLPPGTTVDGEVIALDSHGRPSFNALQNSVSARRPVFYYVFDLLAHDGKPVLDLPLRRRRELLDQSGVRAIGGPIRVSEALDGTAKEVVAAAREQGLEGVVAKRLNSTYHPGAKDGAWVKLKLNQGQEFVVGGYIPGPHGFDSLLVGYYDAGKLLFIAKVRNGFVPRTREQVFDRLRPLETPVCPFANLPEPKNARRGHALTAEFMQEQCRWVKPELVAQVEFTEITGAEHLRHSRFVALRDDKNPAEVVLER